MIFFSDIPTIQIHPTPPESCGDLRIDIAPSLDIPPDIAVVIDRLWDDLRRDNPRLHDGPILLAFPDPRATSSRATDLPALGHVGAENLMSPLRLTVRRATYKTLATASHSGLNVRALGVQGVITARDAAGEEHLLLGRRGSEVRIYQGLWENAPSGTLLPPAADKTSIDWRHITRALLDEGIEELGLNLSAANLTWLAMLDDAQAHSLDVVLAIRMSDPIDPRATPCSTDDTHRWEYAATAWVPTAQVATWAAHHTHAISPPTRALIRHLFAPTPNETNLGTQGLTTQN